MNEREQAERLRDYLESEFDWFGMREDNTVEQLARALHSLNGPPKPQEPIGLGAVVEDDKGDVWVHDRDHEPGYLGVEWLNVRTKAHRRYREIDAVEVLSEGVTG